MNGKKENTSSLITMICSLIFHIKKKNKNYYTFCVRCVRREATFFNRCDVMKFFRASLFSLFTPSMRVCRERSGTSTHICLLEFWPLNESNICSSFFGCRRETNENKSQRQKHNWIRLFKRNWKRGIEFGQCAFFVLFESRNE